MLCYPGKKNSSQRDVKRPKSSRSKHSGGGVQRYSSNDSLQPLVDTQIMWQSEKEALAKVYLAHKAPLNTHQNNIMQYVKHTEDVEVQTSFFF